MRRVTFRQIKESAVHFLVLAPIAVALVVAFGRRW
jgi:hypothetical protein